MNQKRGQMEMPDPEEFDRLLRIRGTREGLNRFQAGVTRGNPDRTGSPLTAEKSAQNEIRIAGWPTLELYERIQIKGVWFKVTRMKSGSGNIGLQMLTTEEALAEGRKVIKPETGDVLRAIEEAGKPREEKP